MGWTKVGRLSIEQNEYWPSFEVKVLYDNWENLQENMSEIIIPVYNEKDLRLFRILRVLWIKQNY